MNEHVSILGKSKSIVGVFTENSYVSNNHTLPLIIILNAGVLHRVGPNRIHVKMARKMADSGFKALRFDFSGLGDSIKFINNLSYENNRIDEAQEAIDYLVSVTGIEKYILIGICSGADIAYQTACGDDRVAGFIGINGFYNSSNNKENIADIVKMKTQARYYKKQITTFEGWKRILKGKSNFFMIKNMILHNLKRLFKQSIEGMNNEDTSNNWQKLTVRNMDVLLIYSDGSSALDEYNLLHKKEIPKFNGSEQVKVEILEQSDHVFTLLWSQDILLTTINNWLLDRNRNWYN